MLAIYSRVDPASSVVLRIHRERRGRLAEPGIEPYQTVAVGASVDGLLESMAVDRGDLVAKGEVIATLESSAERAAVAPARSKAEIESAMKSNQARFDFGVRRFVRTDEMYKEELVPLKELDEAETQKVLAEIGILEAKENRTIAELDLERARVALKTVRSSSASRRDSCGKASIGSSRAGTRLKEHVGRDPEGRVG